MKPHYLLTLRDLADKVGGLANQIEYWAEMVDPDHKDKKVWMAVAKFTSGAADLQKLFNQEKENEAKREAGEGSTK